MASTSSSRSRARVVIEDYGLLLVAGTFVLLAVAGAVLFFVGDNQRMQIWIDNYGLAALFPVFILEGAMLMYFAPSELLVPWGMDALAATPNGYDFGVLAWIFAIAVVGATIGQTALFLLAQRAGREWLLEKPWFRISESKLDRFDAWFDKWGYKAVPVSNALLFTRGMLTVPAGISDMRAREFAVLSAIGTLVFEAWLAIAWHYKLDVIELIETTLGSLL